MLSNIRGLSVLNKIFNLNESEWPKVILSWVMRFLYKGGFVMGWTIIVGMFAARFGIASLPFLFAVNALLTILGTFLYSFFLGKVDKAWMMIVTIFLAGTVLFLSTQVLYVNQVLFFALLLIAEAVFIVQLKIFLDGYIEEIFTPLESERTFPLIEASETIGGIVAGVVIMSFANHIEVFKFVYLWAIFLFLMVPFILMVNNINKKNVIGEEFEEDPHELDCHSLPEKNGFIALIKREFKTPKKFSFLKGMVVLVFFQWLLYNLLEFQYTKAIYNNVSGIILDGGSGFEHAFVHDLGALFVLFSFSVLILQLFIGSRLIDSLGVVGSMLIHPILTFLGLIGMFFSFNFYTAVLAKNNFTLTTAVFTNAYHSTYYAIKEKIREYSREFMEGIVRPIGALVGTFVLIVLQLFLSSKEMVFAVNIIMPVIAVLFLYVVFRQRTSYTKAAIDELINSNDKEERMNALDILSQKGHLNSVEPLLKILNDDHESISLRVKVLKALAENKYESAINDILKCFNSPSAAIREAAVDALFSYKTLTFPVKEKSVARYELIEALKKMYEHEDHEEIRNRIISLLSKISSVSTFEFLLNILQKGDEDVRANALYALGNYKDPDVLEIIRPYLNRGDKEKVNAAITLGVFSECREEACYVVSSFIFSNDDEKKSHGLFAVGEMNLKQFKKTCVEYLGSKNQLLRMNAALALAKMKKHEAIPSLVDLLLNGDSELSKGLKKKLKNVDVRISKNIGNIVMHIVSDRIKKIFKARGVNKLEDLNEKDLLILKRLYCLIDYYDEVEKINKLIN
ncbi:MAG: HEAT repeat domain-containing protein [Candidatus Gracilibacteria bacterium]|nr:HEAT repeat domain-containing protein [Candidatus Gracilibacteria bacterium]